MDMNCSKMRLKNTVSSSSSQSVFYSVTSTLFTEMLTQFVFLRKNTQIKNCHCTVSVKIISSQ